MDTVSRLHASEPPGDILVFLTGQDEVDDVVRKLQAAPPQPGKGRLMSCVCGGGGAVWGVCMWAGMGVRGSSVTTEVKALRSSRVRKEKIPVSREKWGCD